MATFKSKQKTISVAVSTVYSRLSDIEGLKKLALDIPDELKGKADFLVDGDVITLRTKQVGDISLKITKRIENERIKLETVSSPIPFAINVMLASVDANATQLEVETKMELNPIVKPMVSKPIQEMTEKFADFLATLPY